MIVPSSLIGLGGNPFSRSSGYVIGGELELEEHLQAPTGPVGGVFQVGSEGIDLQLDMLPNGLLELDAERCAVETRLPGATAPRIHDACKF